MRQTIRAAYSRQQRYHIISQIAKKPGQQIILLTATPHSGKPEEFHSLLGLLRDDFEMMDIPRSSQSQRKELARYFVQRKRADVEKCLGEDTPFPKRDPIEWPYELSKDYSRFFNEILDFSRKLIDPKSGHAPHKRARYWTALALLRGVMSSPAAGIEMLNSRVSKITATFQDDGEISGQDDKPDDLNPVHDTEFGFDGDYTPAQIMEQTDWTSYQRQQLRAFSNQLEGLSTIQEDQKLASADLIIEDWLTNGFNPVVFCRYIATAKYVGEKLSPSLKRKFPDLDLKVVTSELPDDIRKQHIEEMGKSHMRVLIATDCLSEGINLQDYFTGVLHYDLPWNPNRLEQREGRVDRFGQSAPKVMACLLYGKDNPIDAIVLDVLLRKVREIKRTTGINVPFPEDSQSIIDTIAHALLLNPDRRISKTGDPRQLVFDFKEFNEAEDAKSRVTRKVDEAADREKVSRSIFAQHAIKDQEIETDLREVDEAIGNPKDVESFVINVLNNLFGIQISRYKKGYRIVTGNLPPQLHDLLPHGNMVQVSFESPTPEGYHYLGRNHRFVESSAICMANTVNRVINGLQGLLLSGQIRYLLKRPFFFSGAAMLLSRAKEDSRL